MQGILNGIVDIIREGSSALAQFQSAAAITSVDEMDEVVSAYKEVCVPNLTTRPCRRLIIEPQFARVHQQFITIMTGKASLFTTMGFILQPVQAVLRQDEGIIDVSVVFVFDQL